MSHVMAVRSNAERITSGPQPPDNNTMRVLVRTWKTGRILDPVRE